VTFQAYIDNIRANTGKTPQDFRDLAREAGVLTPSMTATQLVNWLKTCHGMGRGHAMAIYAVFKNEGWAAVGTGKPRRRASCGSER
jgi:hypothetical protein